jgi:NADPH:quinone reductase-like Zn-dependent oxidoreductase
MKAVQFASYGGPEVLQVVDVPEPHAGPGQVRIAVRAAGVNPVDWKLRAGYLKDFMPVELPAGVGSDASGVVDEVGPDVQGVAVGDEVFGTTVTGATAEYAVLGEWATKPTDLPFEEAAGFPMPSETARRALKLLPAQKGQTLLVNGASGGVGLAASQFALADGLTVIGTASEGNHPFLSSIGVVPTTYGEGLVERVRALAPDGVDVALDVAGSGVLPELVQITGDAQNVVTIADFNAGDHGVRLTTGGDSRSPEARQEAAELFEKGAFRLPVAEVFSMSEAGEAHDKSQQGHVLGKFVIVEQ